MKKWIICLLACSLLLLSFPAQGAGVGTAFDEALLTGNSISVEAIAQAQSVPSVTIDNLPDWRGVSMCNKVDYTEEYCGFPFMYEENLIKAVADFGFNFIRVPIHGFHIFPAGDLGRVDMAHVENIDQLIQWSIENGLHVNLDLHNIPGSDHHLPDQERTLYENDEQLEIVYKFWAFFATRYQGVPNSALSFNIINEPPSHVSDKRYSEVMGKAIDIIREVSPDRLIFVDMLDYGTQPVLGLVDRDVVQSIHFYNQAFTHAGPEFNTPLKPWPYSFDPGFVEPHSTRRKGPLTINGIFDGKSALIIDVASIAGTGSIVVKADGNIIHEELFESHEQGKGGFLQIAPYNDRLALYENRLIMVDIPEGTEKLEITSGGNVDYFYVRELAFSGAVQARVAFSEWLRDAPPHHELKPIVVEVAADGTAEIVSNPDFRIDRAYLQRIFKGYSDFSKKHNVPVMLCEFGVWGAVPSVDALAFLGDLLDVANQYRIPWAAWDFFGPFGFFSRPDEPRRSGAEYDQYGTYTVEKGMLSLYQQYQSYVEPEGLVSLGTVTITSSGSVNLRGGPNTEYDIIGKASEGTIFDCIDIAENGWYGLVLEDGSTGYVSPKMAELSVN